MSQPGPNQSRALALMVACALVPLAGCGQEDTELTLADFASTQPDTRPSDARPGQVVPQATQASGTPDAVPGIAGLKVVDADPSDLGPTKPANPRPASDQPPELTLKSFKVTDYTMDAMVGQVNGNPIYASTVLDKLRELEALGRNQPRMVFQQRAKVLIRSTLEQIIYDALILGVAERDLSENERRGLDEILKDHRARLIRQYGQGSLYLADEMAMAKEGKTIEQMMRDFRSIVLVNRYFKQKLLVKVHVSRKDIERYYLDKYAYFNQAPAKRVRFIWTAPDNAAKFEALLKSGRPFKDVASNTANLSRSSQGGLWPDLVQGNEFSDTINQAIARLKQGQYEGPFKVRSNIWWVYCEEEIPAINRPLREVQLEIEELIRRDRTRVLTEKYQAKLFKEGSYGKEAGYNREYRTVESNTKALEEMVDNLLAVAMARFAQPAQDNQTTPPG